MLESYQRILSGGKIVGLKTGPKPKPGAIKKLQGNPGKRPIKDLNYDTLTDLPDPKTYLPEPAKEFWNDFGTYCVSQKILSYLDLPMLEVMANEYADYRDSLEKLKAGKAYKTESGYFQQTPIFSMKNNARDFLTRCLSMFFGTPTERSRGYVQEKGKEGKEEEIEAFLKAGKKLKAVK
jgi:P27 family predicted phage terminase small subunit